MKDIHENNQGFSLVELVVVVAIMAVLTGVLTASFLGYLEKSRESVDGQNIRSQFSEVMAEAILSGDSQSINENGELFGKIRLKQAVTGWQASNVEQYVEVCLFGEKSEDGQPAPGGTAWVKYVAEDNKMYLCYGDEDGNLISELGIEGVHYASLSNAGSYATTLFNQNKMVIYNSDPSKLTAEEKALVAQIKKELNLDDNITIHIGNPSGVGSNKTMMITVCNTNLNESDYTNSGSWAKEKEWATRIVYNVSTNEIQTVTKQYGAWGNNAGTTGFWANTMNGKYPNEELYNVNGANS